MLAASNQDLEETGVALRRSHEELERRVNERTRELEEKNSELVG
jgi:nitrate/nitrite-specific signal transduction histidine kinase